MVGGHLIGMLSRGYGTDDQMRESRKETRNEMGDCAECQSHSVHSMKGKYWDDWFCIRRAILRTYWTTWEPERLHGLARESNQLGIKIKKDKIQLRIFLRAFVSHLGSNLFGFHA